MQHTTLLAALTTVTLLAVSQTARADGDHHAPGAVYTLDNATGANHVLAYARSADGRLSGPVAYDTGGRGTGGGLGNQGALVLSRNGHWLFACNAGSDEISVFQSTPHGLRLTDRVTSGGRRPVSLTLHGNLLYVLNAGGQAGDHDSLIGFRFSGGRLQALEGSTRLLSADNTGPAQVGFAPDGDVLVVTEKATGLIDSYTVEPDGLISSHQIFTSHGQTPFGFAFRGRDLLVSEAFGGAPNGSAVTSYDVADDGELQIHSGSVPTTETAACWVVVSKNGHYAYASNNGSGTLSGYRIAEDGGIRLLSPDGVTGVTGAGSRPIDMALSGDGRFLYTLNAGNGTLGAFRVLSNGALEAVPGISGVPAGSNGLAAR